jgi:hypothetical protein
VYGDRIAIFKEKGLHFPTNFQSIGYIEFESNDLRPGRLIGSRSLLVLD